MRREHASEIEGHSSWFSSASEYLEQAAEDANHSTELVRSSLQAIVEGAPVAGTALVRPPYSNDATPKRWQVEYVGAKARGMGLWIPKQLKDSPESTTLSLRSRSPHFPEVDPKVLDLNPPSAPRGGLWILWPYTADVLKNSFGVEHEIFRRTLESLLDADGVFRQRLESLLEVEYLEQTFLRDSMPMVRRAIQRKEDQALHALLTLARQISGADFTYWGIVRDGFVIVKDYNFGTESEGFEFELPVGKGLGGIAFAKMEPQMTADYMNSGYRYPGVAEAEDRENIRSAIAIPVRSSSTSGSAPGSGGVLYAVRRRVAPFSDAQRALLVRLRKSIEPIPDSWPPLTGSFAPNKKSEYRRIQENPTNIGEVESFVEEIIEGPVIAVDGTGYPYTHSKVEKLNDLLHSEKNDRFRVVPIPGSRAEGERGQLYLWPRVELPLAWWPDLLEDAASLCRVVLHRIEPDQEYTRRRRSRWIERLLEGDATPEKSEAKRLHLQTDRGEVWVVMWEKGPLESPVKTQPDESQPKRKEKRKELKKRRAEDVVWDELDVPLTFIDDNVWIMLLKGEGHENSPGAFRDKLLNYFREDLDPDSALWVVHGAYYSSLGDLRVSLKQTLKAAQDARRERAERYVLEIHSQGLDSLLDNHRIAADLNAFAGKVLQPLVDHDRKSGEQLTKTLCYALTRGSIKDKLGSAAEEAAVPLFVHANTVRNRVKRAEEILGRDLSLQEEKVILGLAAFVWLRRQTKGSEPGSI